MSRCRGGATLPPQGLSNSSAHGQMPESYAMLMRQSQLLLELGDAKTALELAKLVVDMAPAQVRRPATMLSTAAY